jgi:diguanylate cyclase (GGDEF)-like protein
VDVDLFKQYNDCAGHLEGDECLRRIADAIADTVKSAEGFAARIGGEEFAIILPCTAEARAWEIAEEIRRRVQGLGLSHPCTPSGVQTVSLGIAATVPTCGQDWIDLMRLADQALYSAKRSGRNQVACAQSEPPAA